MIGWHYQCNGHEFEEALGVGNGYGSLALLQYKVLQILKHNQATELN